MPDISGPEDDDNYDDDDDDIEGGGNPFFDEPDEMLAAALVELAQPNKKGMACGLADAVFKRVKDLRRELKKSREQNNNSGGRISPSELQKVVEEGVARAVGAAVGKAVEDAVRELRKEVQELRKKVDKQQQAPQTQVPRTWAAVAAAATEPVAKRVPGRLSREMLIRGSTEPALARRSPREVVDAVNAATGRKEAIAARKLPSGDVVVTFLSAKAKEWHEERVVDWVGKTFGKEARQAKRTFAVLVKGVKKGDLKDVAEEAFGRQIGLSSVDKVKFRIPAREGVRATVLVALTSLEEARKACEEGVVWQAQVLACEPFWGVLQAVQCYRCWGWGHTQRFCRKTALCPRCGCGAHGEGGRAGETLCPTLGASSVPTRCANCTGRHPAWVRWCPEAVKARGAAREAYFYRPRTYEQAVQREQQAQQVPIVTFRGTQDEEQREGSRKRLRGRPTALDRAARDPRQGRLNLALRDSTVAAGAASGSGPSQAAAAPAAAPAAGARGEDLDTGMQGV